MITTATLRTALAAAAIAGLSACSLPEDGPGDRDAFVHDPYEASNRDFHEFNKGLDTVALRPAAALYAESPALVRHLVGNALDTLDLPSAVVNHWLQGDPAAAGRTLLRLGVNLVFGLGVLDPATDFGLPKEDADFGGTLAANGIPEGAYLEVPLLGPHTERALFGRVVDAAMDPVGLAAAAAGVPMGVRLARTPADAIDAREANFETIDRVLYDSEDSYVTTRAAYLQLRRRELAGEATEDTLPDVYGE